ncbi:MAG TPA: S8 family serine peptidase [Candidatus Deferrimicrobiaceae bacterium]
MPEDRHIPWGPREDGEPAGRGVAVFVIDSGANPYHSHVRGVAGGARVFRGPDGGILREEGSFLDDLGHGTAITAVIRHVAPAARIHAVKIFSGSHSATVDVLEAALAYAVDAGARVVNLSLAVGEDVRSRPIGELCRDAAGRGVILVASARNGAHRNGYPALLPDVIGVAADGRLGERSLRYLAGEPFECRASGWPRPLPGLPRERNFQGNSFAAARVSGAVACLLERHPGADLASVREMLRGRYG